MLLESKMYWENKEMKLGPGAPASPVKFTTPQPI